MVWSGLIECPFDDLLWSSSSRSRARSRRRHFWARGWPCSFSLDGEGGECGLGGASQQGKVQSASCRQSQSRQNGKCGVGPPLSLPPLCRRRVSRWIQGPLPQISLILLQDKRDTRTHARTRTRSMLTRLMGDHQYILLVTADDHRSSLSVFCARRALS